MGEMIDDSPTREVNGFIGVMLLLEMFSWVGGEIPSPPKTFMGTKERSSSIGGSNVGFGVDVYEYDYKHAT